MNVHEFVIFSHCLSFVDNTGWVVAVTCAVFLVIVISIISSIMFYKLVQKKLPPKTPNPFGPIIRNPTTGNRSHQHFS